MKKELKVVCVVLVILFIIVGFLMVNEGPTIGASVDIDSGYQPLNVSFNANASDIDGTIKSYHWDFGDGNSSREMNPNHIFNAGTHIVTITVIDDKGVKSTDELTIVVNNRPPVADISSDTCLGRIPLTVLFNSSGNDSDGYIVSHHWEFDDGSIGEGQTISHTFVDKGKYFVKLTVIDNNGASTSDVVYIKTVTNILPTADASCDKRNGEVNSAIQFEGFGDDQDGWIVSYHWDFDDGSNCSTQNPSHTYREKRNYIVRLTITDNEGGTDTDSIRITIDYKKIAYQNLKSFLRNDKTNEIEYNDTDFNCVDFCDTLIKNARLLGYKIGFVTIHQTEGDASWWSFYAAHAIVVFDTADKGLIFVEPQADVTITEQEFLEMQANDEYPYVEAWLHPIDEIWYMDFNHYTIDW